MYCRYTKTSILDDKQCPLDGSEFYCVFYQNVLYQRFHCIHCRMNFGTTANCQIKFSPPILGIVMYDQGSLSLLPVEVSIDTGSVALQSEYLLVEGENGDTHKQVKRE